MKNMRSRVPILIFGLSVVFLIFAYFLYKSYSASLYNSSLSRINIGIWGEHSYVLSLGKTTKQHYIFLFGNSYEVQVPGGLKGYKIGALGKLANLEKDPQLFIKAMGEGSGVFIHKYVHNLDPEIYYDDTWLDTMQFNDVKKELLKKIFLPGDLSIFDRVFIYLAIRDARPSQSTLVKVKNEVPNLLLYDKIFRNEKKLVQILYTESERTAYFISQLLENTGIRVADISKNTAKTKGCVIVESTSNFSQTSRFISNYFGCELREGDTGLYEVQWVLDSKVENRWKL